MSARTVYDIRKYFGFGVLPRFQDGERILATSYCLMVSGKSLPSYRVCLIAPPFIDMALIATDRRIFLLAYFLRLLRQEVSIWYEGHTPSAEEDTLLSVAAGKNMWGAYLEIKSETEKKLPLRSKEMKVRCYLRNPEGLVRAISENGVVAVAGPGKLTETAPPLT